jgi:predicted O-methyltransferase YrrM
MEFLPKEIEEYSLSHTSSQSIILEKIENETWQEVLMPRMLSGRQQGRFLSLMSKLVKPKRVLEIGTYTGYSAICISEGLSENGIIHTIDNNIELKQRVTGYFKESGIINSVKMHWGNALEIIPSINEKWDLVFIDADKENYSNYFDSVIEKVNKGGMIIADNVLWSGKVTRPTSQNDIETKALKTFNEKVNADSRVSNVLIPVRDGMMIMIKK